MNMSNVLQPVEKLAKGLVSVVLALSLVAARADFLWLGNSELLNYSAGQKQRKQTVWLRRILLLEVSFWTVMALALYSLSYCTFTLPSCVWGAAEPSACRLPEWHHASLNRQGLRWSANLNQLLCSHSHCTTCMSHTPLC